MFGKVIFNLYSIKKKLNNNEIINHEMKKSIYFKVEEALKKSSEYIKELEIIENENYSDDDICSDNIILTNKKNLIKEILIHSSEGDIIEVQNLLEESDVIEPDEASWQDLKLVHTIEDK